MKTRKLNRLIFAVLAIVVFSLAIISCAKKETPAPGSGTPLTKEQLTQKNLKSLLRKLPKKFIVDGKNVTLTKDGFSFSQPNDGFNYSTNNGVEYSEESQTLYIQPGSFGSGTGGTVVAGSSSLDINYTFCFSASDSALQINFFGPEFSGVSEVIGISGDFSLLEDTSNHFEDIFHGLAIYVVYANEASGNYPILNWFQDLDQDQDDLADKGFAFVIDLINNKLYLSYDGNLNVSGGSIAFNGNYICISGFDAFDPDGEDEISYSIVSGFGAMGCL